MVIIGQDAGMQEVGTEALYQRIATRFGDLLAHCPAGRWSSPSPCDGWTAWDVAAHVIRNHRRALAGLDQSSFSAPVPADDLHTAWRAATGGVRSALRDPTLATIQLCDEFGSLSFEAFVKRMACADTLIHTWDFARATGQDEALDPEAVTLATAMLMPEDNGIRMPQAFGMKVPASDGADAQTRLLNFLGRRV
jgi:uncharacterized protein (TIGR03086 family)